MAETGDWIKRADEILAEGHSAHQASEQMQFATSMITAFYGSNSPQMKTFRDVMQGIYGEKRSGGTEHRLMLHARATIKNIRAELESGLVENVRGRDLDISMFVRKFVVDLRVEEVDRAPCCLRKH